MKWFWNWVILTASSPPDFSPEESKQYATAQPTHMLESFGFFNRTHSAANSLPSAVCQR
jgi:hypothetical protein